MTQLKGVRDTYSEPAIAKAASCFNRIVIWGLHDEQERCTHRHIFRGYYETCRKLGLNVAWVSDRNPGIEILPDDIVFTHGVCHNLGYLMARGPVIVEFNARFFKEALGTDYQRLQNYERRISEVEANAAFQGENTPLWDPLTYYNAEGHYLSQPWGSDLLDREFLPPVDSSFSDTIYWMGTWWLDHIWGNFDEIAAMRAWAEKNRLRLVQFTDCDAARNTLFVRNSRIAPAIGGKPQADADYLACRFFKNISYGQFAVSNIAKSRTILGDDVVFSRDIPALLDRALFVAPKEALDMARYQQSRIKNYTIAAHIYITLVTAIVHFCNPEGV